MVGISRPIVKHSFQVRHASEIPAIIKKAFYIASSGRPGPVVVDIPKDATNPAENLPTNILKSEDAFISTAFTWTFRSNS